MIYYNDNINVIIIWTRIAQYPYFSTKFFDILFQSILKLWNMTFVSIIDLYIAWLLTSREETNDQRSEL